MARLDLFAGRLPVSTRSAPRSLGGYFRPLYAWGISASWLLWHDVTWLWHVENVGWHVGVVWLLYALGVSLTARTYDRAAAKDGQQRSMRIAFWAALLFAVSPLGVHSVAWISGRKDLQCALCGSLAVLAFLHVEGSRRRWLWSAASVLSTACAVGFKELGFCIPILLSAWAAFDDRRLTRASWITLAAQFTVAAALGFYRFVTLGAVGLNVDYPATSWLANLATSARLAWHYLGRVFIPIRPQISDRWRITQHIELVDVAAIAGLCALLGLTIFWFWRRRPWFIPISWYGIWMLPATGLLPLRHLRAERYLYPAAWGLALLFSWAIDEMARRGERYRMPLTAGMWIVTLALAVHTMNESAVWRGDRSLFEEAVKRDPLYLEGQVALAQLALREEKYEECIAHAELAERIAEDRSHTSYWSPLIAATNHGLALYYTGNYAAARRAFDRAHKVSPNNATALYHLGLVTLKLGEPQAARRYFQSANEIRPGDYLTVSNLALVELQLGNAAACRSLLRPLLEERPDDPINLRNLAAASLVLKDFAAAVPPLRRLEQLELANAVDYAKLAWSYSQIGNSAEAGRCLAQARARDPQDPVVRQIEQIMGRGR